MSPSTSGSGSQPSLIRSGVGRLGCAALGSGSIGQFEHVPARCGWIWELVFFLDMETLSGVIHDRRSQ